MDHECSRSYKSQAMAKPSSSYIRTRLSSSASSSSWSQSSSLQNSPKVTADDGLFRYLGLDIQVDKENFDRFLKYIINQLKLQNKRSKHRNTCQQVRNFKQNTKIMSFS